MKKNTLLVVGVFAVTLVAALLAWAVFGGSGGGRRAILEEPTQSGSIGSLSISGVDSARQMPIRSFNWRAAWTCAGQVCAVRADPLEVLRGPSEASPGLFNALMANAVVASGQLDLLEPEAGAPYLQLEVTNGRVTEVGPGKHEQVAVAAPLPSAWAVTRGEGAPPAADRSLVVGQMTFRDDTELPIYGISGGPNRQATDPIVVRRPLDHVVEPLWTDLRQQSNVGQVTIELQEPGARAPYVTYQLGAPVLVRSVTISAAAGRTPTAEFALTYRTLQVTSGTRSYCFNFQTFSAC